MSDAASVPIVHDIPKAEDYDSHYYGHAYPPKANYKSYGEPHWSGPLAQLLIENFRGPFLDVGAAFGHLVRDLNALDEPAFACDWSPHAVPRAVTKQMRQADARNLRDVFADTSFNTVVSMDLLEHFVPDETEIVMDEMIRVLRPGGAMVHLIGFHNPIDDLSAHMSDPTHRNHEPVEWYHDQFARRGFAHDDVLTAVFRDFPLWRESDWPLRWHVYVDARTGL